MPENTMKQARVYDKLKTLIYLFCCYVRKKVIASKMKSIICFYDYKNTHQVGPVGKIFDKVMGKEGKFTS